MSEINKRLYRSNSDRMLAGVCGGLGEFFGIDPTVIRVLSVLLTLVWPFTPLAYLILMFVVPEEPVGE
jgi:phage shock protein PspC (stress-responsive transcriptional regulator)